MGWNSGNNANAVQLFYCCCAKIQILESSKRSTFDFAVVVISKLY